MAVVETFRLPVGGGGAVFCEVAGHGPPVVLTANPNNLRPKEHLERAFESPVLARLSDISTLSQPNGPNDNPADRPGLLPEAAADVPDRDGVLLLLAAFAFQVVRPTFGVALVNPPMNADPA